MHAALTNEYPALQVVIAVYDVHANTFLPQVAQAVPDKKNPLMHVNAVAGVVVLQVATPGAHAVQVVVVA